MSLWNNSRAIKVCEFEKQFLLSFTCSNKNMKATVIHAPGKVSCDMVDYPRIKNSNDVILKLGSMLKCS